jgi:hypothetical protein
LREKRMPFPPIIRGSRHIAVTSGSTEAVAGAVRAVAQMLERRKLVSSVQISGSSVSFSVFPWSFLQFDPLGFVRSGTIDVEPRVGEIIAHYRLTLSGAGLRFLAAFLAIGVVWSLFHGIAIILLTIQFQLIAFQFLFLQLWLPAFFENRIRAELRSERQDWTAPPKAEFLAIAITGAFMLVTSSALQLYIAHVWPTPDPLANWGTASKPASPDAMPSGYNVPGYPKP